MPPLDLAINLGLEILRPRLLDFYRVAILVALRDLRGVAVLEDGLEALDVLAWLHQQLGDRDRVVLFGCSNQHYGNDMLELASYVYVCVC